MDDPRFKLNRSIKFLVWEGTFTGVLSGLVEVYAAAYCLFLGAGPSQIALLASFPLLFGSLFQLKAPLLIRKFNSRKRVIRLAILIHALLSFLMAFAFLLGPGLGVSALIAGFCLFSIAGQMAHIAWTSWVGDLVPSGGQGQFFGRRTQWNHIAIFAATLAGGAFLQWMKNSFGLEAQGFCLLYLAGGCFRLLCLPCNSRVEEPKPEFLPVEASPRLVPFLKNILKENFGRFVLFAALIQTAVFLAHPFVAPYFLEELKINYFTYSLLFATIIVGRLAFFPLWGKFSDRRGAKKTLKISAILFSFSPLLYLFSSNIFWLFGVQACRAISWSGYDVTLFKFQMDATDSGNRSHHVSYLNAINGVLAVFGATAGSLLVRPSFLGSPYLLPFLSASILMILACVVFLPRLKEPQGSSLTRAKTAAPMAGAAVKPGESVPSM